MDWADKYRTLKIRTNADTPEDAKRAREFGAEGIGLCRTEHMFFEGDRIMAMREMILADNEEDRKKALKKLLPLQRKDFIGIFKAMKGLPVTIRLLDPPLHEFLPHDAKSQAEMAKELGVTPADVKDRVGQLHEVNPMLGHRGCRLAVTYPEILEMQVTAIVEAVIACKQKKIDAQAEIMIPLVGTAAELKMLAEQIRSDDRRQCKDEKKFKGKLDILDRHDDRNSAGRADGRRDRRDADFFSFGTNDLTQMTFGFSRDDINTFLPDYLKQEILLARSVPVARHDGRRPAGRDGRQEGPLGEEGPQVRHLRRARRRSRLDQVLPQGRPGLRVVQPVPRADRPPGGGPGGAGQWQQIARSSATEKKHKARGVRSPGFAFARIELFSQRRIRAQNLLYQLFLRSLMLGKSMLKFPISARQRSGWLLVNERQPCHANHVIHMRQQSSTF